MKKMGMPKIDLSKIKAPIGAALDKITALPQAHKVLLAILTVALLGGSFYWFIYQEQVIKIRQTRGAIADQEKRLAQLKQAAQQVDILQKDLAKAEEEFSYLLTFLPDQKEIPGLLESVSQLGAQVGLENILFQPQPEQTFEFHAAIPIRLDLVGTFNDLGVFLDHISKMHRILRVESLSLSKRAGNQLQVGCTLFTYRFIEKAQQPAPPAKK